MKFDEKKPPREFTVGKHLVLTLKDYGNMYLEPNEQITFVTDEGSEYDVTKKSWGFYATPSVNGRLKKFGFKTALVRNDLNHFYIMLVESGKIDDFMKYITDDRQELVEWLDERPALT